MSFSVCTGTGATCLLSVFVQFQSAFIPCSRSKKTHGKKREKDEWELNITYTSHWKLCLPCGSALQCDFDTAQLGGIKPYHDRQAAATRPCRARRLFLHLQAGQVIADGPDVFFDHITHELVRPTIAYVEDDLDKLERSGIIPAYDAFGEVAIERVTGLFCVDPRRKEHKKNCVSQRIY